jgi:adenine phosphoribosyltransferase
MSPVSIVADGPAVIDIRASSLPDSTAAASLSEEQRNQIISDSIRGIPDFPKPGILFWDVTTLLLNPQAFQLTIDAMVERYKDQKVDVVAGA